MTEKNLKRKLYLNIAFAVIGLAMAITGWVLSAMKEGEFSGITGMGVGILAVGILRILQIRKILKGDREALKKLTEGYDERNVMIYNKAMTTTMKFCLFVAFIAMFVLYILEKTVAANVVGWVILGSVAVYSICHWIYSKKY